MSSDATLEVAEMTNNQVSGIQATTGSSRITDPSIHYLQQELETLLQTNMTMWRFLQAGSLDGIWYWDLENPNEEWMSPEVWQLLGIDPATKSHSPSEWQDLIFAEDLAVAVANFEKHCADPNHPYDQIVRYRHASGSTVWVRCRGIAIRDENGKPIRMLGAHNDLTAVKEAEQQAASGKIKAEAANDELKSFAYSVSHDMKSPANTLQLILSELQMHLQEQNDRDGLELTEFALQSIERMRDLIENVLDYTRVVGQKPTFETVDLTMVVHETLDSLTSAIDTVGGRVSVGELPAIRANAMQMKLLFQNLISNGLKFRRPGVAPELTVDSIRNPVDGGVIITIRDNGIGIAPEHHERIFTMFERLHQKEDYEGSGLGLPLCRRIVINHGGKILIESEPGQGTAFMIELPGVVQ